MDLTGKILKLKYDWWAGFPGKKFTIKVPAGSLVTCVYSYCNQQGTSLYDSILVHFVFDGTILSTTLIPELEFNIVDDINQTKE